MIFTWKKLVYLEPVETFRDVWLGSQYTSLKLTIKTSKQCHFIVVPLLLTLKIFGTLRFTHISHTLLEFYKLMFSLFWTSKRCLGSFSKIYGFYIFYSSNLSKFCSGSLPVNSWGASGDISRQTLVRNLKVFVGDP